MEATFSRNDERRSREQVEMSVPGDIQTREWRICIPVNMVTVTI